MSGATTLIGPKKGPQVARPMSKGNLSRYSGRVGDAVRKRRDALGMSANDLRKALESRGTVVGLMTIYGWETGRNQIPLDALPELAAVFRTTVRELLPRK